jgi:hypothetical protein
MLPVLMIIVAGTLEVTNLLTAYNRLQLTAREGARFGGGGGTNSEIAEIVIEGASSGTLATDFEDVYVIRPTINSSGTGWVEDTWVETHVYGDGPESSAVSPDEVLADLQSGAASPSYLADMELVVVAVRYDAETVLGLGILPLESFEGDHEGRLPLQAYGVMPLQAEHLEHEPVEACSFFPMGCQIEDTLWGFGEDLEGGETLDEILDSIPLYTEFTMPIYGSGEGMGCDFFVCDVGPGNSDAAAAMNSGCGGDPEGHGSGRDVYTDPDPFDENESRGEPTPDHTAHIGDWAWMVDEQAAGHGVWNALMRHCDTIGGANSCPEDPNAMRIFIYDNFIPFEDNQPGGPQSDQIARIARYAIIQITNVEYDGGYPTSITMRFLGWDPGCEP